MLHGNKFSPWEDFFINLSVLMSSVLTIMYMYMYVYRYSKHMQWNNELEQVLLLGSTIVSSTLSLFMFTSMVGIKVFGLGVITKSSKRTRDK